MTVQAPEIIDLKALASLCTEHHIQRLSLFGSAVRGELRPDSDVDLLVEYDPAHRPGLVALQDFEDALSRVCGGRKVDLVNSKFLNPRLKGHILKEARVLYGEG